MLNRLIAQTNATATLVVDGLDTINEHSRFAAAFLRDLREPRDLYATVHQERRALALRLVAGLDLPQQGRVLEVGCGAGLTALTLASRGHSVIAIDLFEEVIRIARRTAAESGLEDRLKLQVSDVHHLPFPANSFDVVIALGVLPGLQSLLSPMFEMTRVLKPGGHLITNIDNPSRLSHILDPLIWLRPARKLLWRLGLLAPPETPASQTCSIGEFDTLLRFVGLSKSWSTTLGFGPFSFFRRRFLSEAFELRLHHRLQNWSSRGFPLLRSSGAQYIVLARKFSKDASVQQAAWRGGDPPARTSAAGRRPAQ